MEALNDVLGPWGSLAVGAAGIAVLVAMGLAARRACRRQAGICDCSPCKALREGSRS